MFWREPRLAVGQPATMAAIALGVVAILPVGCGRTPPEPTAANLHTETPTALATAAAQTLPAPLPVLTRGDLVSAAGQAASAYAEGSTSTASDGFVGRSFAVVIPFGCTGPAAPEAVTDKRDGLASWSWGPDRKTVQLSIKPGDWTGSALLSAGAAAQNWEAVEGFWIPRPWLAAESCPLVKTDPLQTGASPASPQTVGLAAVFEGGSSRIGRRNGRAYEFTVRAKGDEPLPSPDLGYRLRLEGRIVSFPSGRAIACRAPGPDQRPVCVIAMQLDRVAFEDAKSINLSEWRPD